MFDFRRLYDKVSIIINIVSKIAYLIIDIIYIHVGMEFRLCAYFDVSAISQ